MIELDGRAPLRSVSEAQTAVADHWRQESATIVATLVRMVGDVGLAEELAQDALVAALEQWPRAGIPDEPAAWLTTVARRRTVDHLRRTGRLEALDHDPSRAPGPVPDDRSGDDGGDDVLRLMLLTCHPALARDERTAMTLRLVAGLDTAEIARAFLLHEQQVVARIAHAKRTLAEVGVEASGDLAGRLGAVLEVVYLVFNEGYTATAGEDLLRPGLVDEALRLGRLLAAHASDDPEAHGLLALMELQASRSAARVDATGSPLPLDAQDRSRWDREAIRRGVASLLRAREVGTPGLPGPYVLQAAIAVQHARAAGPEDTDRAQVAALYDLLVAVLPTPVVRLNRAVAVAAAHGPEAGLAAVDELVAEGALRDYHLLPAVRADLLGRLGRDAEARVEWRRAAALTANAAERALLLRRADALAAAAASGPTLGPAVERFLAREDLSPASRRSYGQTLGRLVRALGDARPLSSLDADGLGGVLTATWGAVSAATWNRHRAAARSFAAWLGRPELAAGLPARDVPPRPSEPAPGLPDGPLRERAFWALLADSGATVTDVLALDVDDLDLARHRAGAVRWSPATNGLLRALVGSRAAGPLFLTDRRPGPERRPGARDLCPHTGRRRLSYERAEYLFKRASGGSTLRCLRLVSTNPSYDAE
jgi:predicted RNA polymerase sigma factor